MTKTVVKPTLIESPNKRKRRHFRELKIDESMAFSSPKPDLLAHAKSTCSQTDILSTH